MKYFIIMFIFLNPDAFAYAMGIESCGTFSFKGTPRLLGAEMVLIINEKSLSEVVLKIPPNETARIAPYLEIMTTGEVTLSKVTGLRSGVVDTFAKLDYSTHDPVNTTQNTFLKPVKRRKCL